jgi:uncharacterized protein (TIGR02145 family)
MGNITVMQKSNYLATKQPASKKLVSVTNWIRIPGNNESGFNAHPAGYIFRNIAPIDGDISEFWTATGHSFSIQEGADLTYHRLTFYDNSASGEYKFNVRFVRDK